MPTLAAISFSQRTLSQSVFLKSTHKMACLFCFSGDPLGPDEAKGKYGSALGPYATNPNKYDITMCQAPCKEPCCCLFSMACLCPIQIHMRHKALNHVEPGSGWKNYKCCQGMFGSCCCFKPGEMGESTCPLPCMCLEAFCCVGPAISATSGVIRHHYSLGLDEDDVRLIRCNNCLQIFAICLTCISICTPCEADDLAASIVNIIADVVFCSVGGCMTAQTYHEIKKREAMSAPVQSQMGR